MAPLGAARTIIVSGADLGQLELIQTQTVSSVSNINFTNLRGSSFNTHLLTVNDLQYTSSGDNMSIRVSNDGGSSYVGAGGSGTAYEFATYYGSQVANFNEYKSTGTHKYDIGLLGGVGAPLSCNFYAYIYNANDSNSFTFFSSHGSTFSSAVHHAQGMFYGGGAYAVAETVNAFTLFGDGGDTIANATVSLYGLKE